MATLVERIDALAIAVRTKFNLLSGRIDGIRLGTTALGYATGAGGAVTQATSRTTGVTLSKPTGAITLFSKTTTANLIETFTVTNTTVAVGDTINLSTRAATGVYLAFVTNVAAGSFNISIFTPVAIAAAAAPVINFAVIKAVSA